MDPVTADDNTSDQCIVERDGDQVKFEHTRPEVRNPGELVNVIDKAEDRDGSKAFVALKRDVVAGSGSHLEVLAVHRADAARHAACAKHGLRNCLAFRRRWQLDGVVHLHLDSTAELIQDKEAC